MLCKKLYLFTLGNSYLGLDGVLIVTMYKWRHIVIFTFIGMCRPNGWVFIIYFPRNGWVFMACFSIYGSLVYHASLEMFHIKSVWLLWHWPSQTIAKTVINELESLLVRTNWFNFVPWKLELDWEIFHRNGYLFW